MMQLVALSHSVVASVSAERRGLFFFLLVSKCRHALWGLLPSFGDVTHARESLCCLSKRREPALTVPPSDSPMPDSHNTHTHTPPAPILAEHA